MRNERHSFMRSAIAAAISSSFICTNALATPTKLYFTIWNQKTQDHKSPGTLSYTESDSEDSHKHTVKQPPRGYEHAQPYFQLASELEDKGIKVVVHTQYEKGNEGVDTATFTVSILKNNMKAFTMSESINSGDVTFTVHPELLLEYKDSLTEELQQETLTDSNTGIITVEGTRKLLEKLTRVRDLGRVEENDFETITKGSVTPNESPAPFINDVLPGTLLPDIITAVDTDRAIALIMMAFASEHLPESIDRPTIWAGVEADTTPLNYMLESSTAYQVGSREVGNLADVEAPVFLFKQDKPQEAATARFIPRSAIASAYLKHHRSLKDSSENQAPESVSGYKELKLTRETVKDLRRQAYNAQLDRLIRMQARHKKTGETPSKEGMNQLASDEEMILLCDAELNNTAKKEKHITLSADKQQYIATKVNQKSLTDLIRGQFVLHPDISAFIMGDAFRDAASLLPDIPPDDTDSESLKYLAKHFDDYYQHKQDIVEHFQKISRFDQITN